MRRSVFRALALCLAISLVLCGLLSAVIFDRNITETTKSDMIRLVGVMSDSFDPGGDHNEQAGAMSRAAGGLRVTVIEADGTVTGDSDADFNEMENHGDRAEILEAFGTTTATSVRASETLGTRLMYAVQRLESGQYIRVAVEYSGLLQDLVAFLPAILLAALISLGLSLLLAGRIARNISRPIVAMNASLTGIKDGSTLLTPEDYPYEELRDMSEKINGLSRDISHHLGSLQDEKDKIDFILDNMEEGLLLLDEEGRILLINKSACTLFRCDRSVLGKHILHATRDQAFNRSLERAANLGESTSEDLRFHGRIVEVRFGVVQEHREKIGGSLIVTLSDVTDTRDAVRMRREFFANASHELKTPITSIKGCAELLSSGLSIDQEQMDELLSRIALESDRLYCLIEDILKINRLESGVFAGSREQVDLRQIIDDCCGEVKALADKRQITMNIDTEPCTIWAVPKDVREMVSNLLVNAVQYNTAGGGVDVRLTAVGDQAVLTVRNDGEPIAPEHQQRVFERFYRVDSGRSKSVGGTGLGLAIVKHVVDDLDGDLALTSDGVNGTTFTVTLPLQKRA